METTTLGQNIIIECPEEIANELGITCSKSAPFTFTMPSSSHHDNHSEIHEEPSFITLNNADFGNQQESHDTADSNSSECVPNRNEDVDQLYEPFDENSTSSSNEKISSENSVHDETEIPPMLAIDKQPVVKRKRALKGQGNPSLWKKNINIKKRRRGEEYEGRKLTPEKNTIPILKKSRQLGPSCTSDACSKTQSRHCKEFTEEDRLIIFNNFWEHMDWGQRKVYVSGLIDVCSPKTKKKPSEEQSKKSFTLMYYLKKKSKRLSVCKLMFLRTLGIGEWTARDWALKGHHKSPLNVINRNVPLKPVQNKHLESFLNELPKMPSHYCRSQSSKLYLESIFKSQKGVYDLYVENCTEAKMKPLSISQFKKIYAQMNIGLFQPKKDQCDLCCMHEVNNLSEEKWMEHQQRKEEGRNEMKADTERAKVDKSILVLTMDLQAVLLCPLLKASAIYYKKKLIVHNFTIFNNVTHEVTCYVWHEGEGNVTANEFASCIVDFIEKSYTEQINEIILWSDGCTYQNRNCILSNALLQCSASKNVSITQKILEKGHTQMSCDSVHSVIERKIKNRIISVPADYVNIMEIARKNPMPYSVSYKDHTFFKAYSNLKFYNSIRPGKKAGDPVVTDIRALKYSGLTVSIEYKLRITDDWKPLPQRPAKFSTEKPVPLFITAPGIQKDKFDHLQELTKVLKPDYRPFYANLKYY